MWPCLTAQWRGVETLSGGKDKLDPGLSRLVDRTCQLSSHCVDLCPLGQVVCGDLLSVVYCGPVEEGDVLRVPLVDVKPVIDQLADAVVGAVLGGLDNVEGTAKNKLW